MVWTDKPRHYQPQFSSPTRTLCNKYIPCSGGRTSVLPIATAIVMTVSIAIYDAFVKYRNDQQCEHTVSRKVGRKNHSHNHKSKYEKGTENDTKSRRWHRKDAPSLLRWLLVKKGRSTKGNQDPFWQPQTQDITDGDPYPLFQKALTRMLFQPP